MTGVAPMPALRKTTGASPGSKSEVASWRAHIQHVANLHPLVDIGARDAVRFALNAYAIASGRWVRPTANSCA